jgi:hypothetical protein
MGHQLLGKLPAHRLLPEIVRYLVEGGTPTEDLVDEVTAFGQKALELVDNLQHLIPLFRGDDVHHQRTRSAEKSEGFPTCLELAATPGTGEPNVRDYLLALKDPVLHSCTLVADPVPQAAGSGDFLCALQELGLRVNANPLMPDLLVAYDAALQGIQRRTHADLTDLSEIFASCRLGCSG